MFTDYWRELTSLLEKMARLGTIGLPDLSLVFVTDSVEAAIEHIRVRTIETNSLKRVVRRHIPWLGEQGLNVGS